MIRLLVVDDSPLMRKLIGEIFREEADFTLRYARNGREALELLAEQAADVVTLDVQMPVMGGLECLDRIMIERPCAVVMVSSLTAEGAEATFEALRLGAVDFVAKPGGAISLAMHTLAPVLVRTVRAAAAVALLPSLRLRERVRHRISDGAAQRRVSARPGQRGERPAPTGDGLVLVGASTGGPPALEAVLAPLPAEFRWPILVAQHMPAGFTSSLAQRLNRVCALQVVELTQPTQPRPGCVYIARGDADMIVSQRATRLVAVPNPGRADYPWHPSVDRLVRSALERLPASQLIGVLLTGMGNDGAQAMTAVHEAGGRTIAEAEETAVVWGMPGELVKADGADWVLPISSIAAQLQKLLP